MSAKDRKGGGAKLQRTETVTIRLDPKMRYMAELASRLQRRSLSSYIEWAIDQSFSTVSFPGGERTLADMANKLWDVDEPDRFVTLAVNHPDLLNHEEQRRWKLIRENGYLWRGSFVASGSKQRWTWDPTKLKDVILDRLREHWDEFVAVASGDAEADVLPDWVAEEPVAPTKTPPKPTPKAVEADFSDFPGALEDEDDDLPF